MSESPLLLFLVGLQACAVCGTAGNPLKLEAFSTTDCSRDSQVSVMISPGCTPLVANGEITYRNAGCDAFGHPYWLDCVDPACQTCVSQSVLDGVCLTRSSILKSHQSVKASCQSTPATKDVKKVGSGRREFEESEGENSEEDAIDLVQAGKDLLKGLVDDVDKTLQDGVDEGQDIVDDAQEEVESFLQDGEEEAEDAWADAKDKAEDLQGAAEDMKGTAENQAQNMKETALGSFQSNHGVGAAASLLLTVVLSTLLIAVTF